MNFVLLPHWWVLHVLTVLSVVAMSCSSLVSLFPGVVGGGEFSGVGVVAAFGRGGGGMATFGTY